MGVPKCNEVYRIAVFFLQIQPPEIFLHNNQEPRYFFFFINSPFPHLFIRSFRTTTTAQRKTDTTCISHQNQFSAIVVHITDVESGGSARDVRRGAWRGERRGAAARPLLSIRCERKVILNFKAELDICISGTTRRISMFLFLIRTSSSSNDQISPLFLNILI